MGMRWISLFLVAACAGTSARYGTVALKSGASASAPPATYSVGEKAIYGNNLQANFSDGCVRGSIGSAPIQFCQDANDPTRWSGASGDFTARATDDGRAVQVAGWMALDAARRVQMDQVIPLGSGSQWDELRRHPELLAIAATAGDLKAARIRP